MPKNIAVLGTGYWGINHVRCFYELGALRGIFDADPKRLLDVHCKFPGEKTYQKIEDVLADPAIGGVIVATPAQTHYEIAKQALEHNKDVLVEKPLALKLSQAEELQGLAQKKSRVLMVGHLLQYHPALIELKNLVTQGDLGKIEYVYSNRLNLGKIRTEENILWSFAPHDVSVMLWLLDAMPIQANVVGGNYLQPNITDTTVSTFLFDNGVRAHIFVSWLHPFKEQRLVVIGSKKMAVFNDQAEGPNKLMLYDKNVTMIDGQYVVTKQAGQSISYDPALEPLKAECEHFISCIRSRKKPKTDGAEGLRVLKVLHSCQRSLQMNGQPVQVTNHPE